MRDDDAFWAARRVAAFSDEMIRAIVHTGQFTDPVAEKAVADIMIKRRDAIVRTYLPAVNPIVAPRFDNNRRSFENAALLAGVGHAPEAYRDVCLEVLLQYRATATPFRRNGGFTATAMSSQRNTRKFIGLLFIAIITPYGNLGPSAADEISRPSVASARPRNTTTSRE